MKHGPVIGFLVCVVALLFDSVMRNGGLLTRGGGSDEQDDYRRSTKRS